MLSKLFMGFKCGALRSLQLCTSMRVLSIRMVGEPQECVSEIKWCHAAEGEASQRMESLERYRDKKRRRLFSGAKTIRYEKRKVNADRR